MRIHTAEICRKISVRFGSFIVPIIHINSVTGNKVITKTMSAQTAKILPKIFFKIVFFILKLYFPVNRIFMLLHQQFISFGKMFATKKTIIGT